MKTNKTNLVLALMILAAGSVSAQVDSVRIKQNSTTTSTVETQIDNTEPVAPVQTQPAPAATTAPAPAVAPAATQVDDDNTEYVLRHGELGIRYMPTFATLRLRDAGGDAVQGEVAMSHGWGIMGAVNFNHHVGIQAEVNYHQINQQFKDRGLDRQVNVSYLNIPVMLSLNTDKAAPVNLNFVVGPQFGLNVGAEIDGDSNGNADEARATVGAKSGDVGAAYGVGLEFMLNSNRTLRLDVGFRGYYGLVDMSANEVESPGPNETYNVLLKASRKTYSGYLGLTWLF